MSITLSFSLSLSLVFFYLQAIPALPTHPPSTTDPGSKLLHSNTHTFSQLLLKDVLKAISSKHGWNFDDVRLSKLDPQSIRFGKSQKYEFRVRIGKRHLVLTWWDKESRWRKFRQNTPDFGALISHLSSIAVLDTFRIEGPVELSVENGGHELSLLLPQSSTHTGLKRILVGEGICIEVKRAHGISLHQASDLGFPESRSLSINRSELWPFWNSFSFPLPPIKIFGSASLVAYKTQNPNYHIQSVYLSNKTIELLAERCYTRHSYKMRACPIGFLAFKLALVEKLLKSFLGNKFHQSGLSNFVKAQVEGSTVVRFQLELERSVSSDDAYYSTLAEWRTRPSTERFWFEVVARIEAEKLKPLVVKKVKLFSEADSISWSSLMSNISFTKFSSILVPPEALTLDVKW